MPANITLFHGTCENNFAPYFGGGREFHDYGNGFYMTEDVEAAKEWACQGRHDLAYVYVYELDVNGLCLLDLDEDDALAWVSVLMTHRRSKKIRGAALERCAKLIERYGVEVNKYDLIRGFRANDSYFQFTTDFVTDVISFETLVKSISAGDLGKQVCVKSEKAYRQLGSHVDIITIEGTDYERYHNNYSAKDIYARTLASNYSNEPQIGRLLSDIMKGGS